MRGMVGEEIGRGRKDEYKAAAGHKRVGWRKRWYIDPSCRAGSPILAPGPNHRERVNDK